MHKEQGEISVSGPEGLENFINSTYSQFYNPKRNYKAISNNYIFILDKYESNSIYKELRILQKNNDILKKSLIISFISCC